MELKHDHLTRQLDLIPVSCLSTPITVVGAGAIGSLSVLALAKMGFENITVYDFDEVTVENMNCQFYRFRDIGRLKVEALRDLVEEFTKVKISAVPMEYPNQIASGILVVAVDSMAARKAIWESQVSRAVNLKAFIDPRMGAENALLFVMNPMLPRDIEAYAKSLYTDEAAMQERCTAKSTMYTSMMLSGLVAQSVKEMAIDNSKGIRTAQWAIKDHDFIGWSK